MEEVKRRAINTFSNVKAFFKYVSIRMYFDPTFVGLKGNKLSIMYLNPYYIPTILDLKGDKLSVV